MKTKVVNSLCIGCGSCVAIASEVFDINDEGLAYALNEQVNDEFKEVAMEAKDCCPTNAIVIEE